MKKELQNHWFALRLLLLINIVLIGAIFLMHFNAKHTSGNSDCTEKNIRNLSADAVNSVIIKLM